jgi:hypothetical protein
VTAAAGARMTPLDVALAIIALRRDTLAVRS